MPRVARRLTEPSGGSDPSFGNTHAPITRAIFWVSVRTQNHRRWRSRLSHLNGWPALLVVVRDQNVVGIVLVDGRGIVIVIRLRLLGTLAVLRRGFLRHGLRGRL